MTTQQGSGLNEYRDALTTLVGNPDARAGLSLQSTLGNPPMKQGPQGPEADRIRHAFLVAEIGRNLCGSFSLKYAMAADQVANLAILIVENYGHRLSASAFVAFTKAFTANRAVVCGHEQELYGELFSRLDGEIILSALRRFMGWQRQERDAAHRIGWAFIDALAGRLPQMADAEIAALPTAGTRHERLYIQNAVRHYLKWCGRRVKGLPEDWHDFPPVLVAPVARRVESLSELEIRRASHPAGFAAWKRQWAETGQL